MSLDDIDFEELEKHLDPATRMVVALLRKSNEQLLAANKTQSEHLSKQSEQISHLTDQIEDLRTMLFGRKSEKMPSMKSEVRRAVTEEELFPPGSPEASLSDEEEKKEEKSNAEKKEEDEEKKKIKRNAARKKSEPARKAKRKLKKNLPVVEEVVQVAEGQLPEGYTLADFREVAKDGKANTVTRVDHVREHLVRVEYRLQTLASHDGEHIITAAAPPSVVEGGHYGPGVYADVVVNKCVDSLPLHRIEQRYERSGFPVSRSTLCALFHRTADIFGPVYKHLLETACNDEYVSADETRLPVQKPGKCKDEWIWTLVTKQVVAYYFSESRSASVPKALLAGTVGHLQIDGYSAYNGVCENKEKKQSGRIRVGCLAHARRMFFKAMKNNDIAKEMLDMILELYLVEYLAASREIVGTPEHLLLRQVESRKILEHMETWLANQKPNFGPRTKMGKAIGYAQNQWNSLVEFTNDPRLRLDNNYSENALRIVALGRKNYLFAGHEEGGHNLAVLQTIAATCKLHGVNPYDYIKDVIIKLQQPETRDVEPYLPWNWSKPPPA